LNCKAAATNCKAKATATAKNCTQRRLQGDGDDEVLHG
jgi:hypothetical protein